MNWITIFQWIVLRYYKKNWFKLIFTCLGISLGLALFITTRSYSDTILNYISEQTQFKSFANITLKSKTGKISLEEYSGIVSHEYVNHAVAKVEQVAKVYNHKLDKYESIRIIGLDMINIPSDGPIQTDLNDIESLFSLPYKGISNNLDQLSKDDSINISINQRNINIPVLKTEPFNYNKENMLFLDLVVFYEIIPNAKSLSEVDVSVPNDNVTDLNYFLAEKYPNIYSLEPTQHAKSVKQLSDSFSVNLIFLSSFAILVSILISYQFFNFISVSRQKTYEKCLAIGMTQRQLIGVIILEMGIIFMVSYAMAIIIGAYLGKVSLFAIRETISLLYYPINPSDIVISNKTLVTAFFIGLLTYIINCIEPIITIKSKNKFFRHGYDQISNQSKKKLILGLIVGMFLMWLSCYYIRFFIDITKSVYGGYMNMLFYLLGTACIIPLLLFLISSMMRKLKHPIVTASLLTIEKFPIKNLVTISALSLAFCLYLSLAFFINSFRTTVIDWIEYSNWADVYIYNEANKIEFEVPIDPMLLEQFMNHEDVAFWDPISHYEITLNTVPTSVIASKIDVLNAFEKRLKLFNNIQIEDPFKEVYVSESFYQKNKKGVGDSITIYGDLKTVNVVIKDIFFSYGTDRGIIQMSTELAGQLFHSKGVHGLGIKLSKSIKDTSFFDEFSEPASKNGILLSSNKGLRDRALETFDQTFKITWMLAVISGVIATLALINYVSITLIDRLDELIQLRSIGASHRFMRLHTYVQIALVTGVSLMVSGMMTVGILHILIETINKPIFGWTITVNYSVKPIIVMVGIAIIISIGTLLAVYQSKKKSFELIRIGHDL